MSHLRCETGFSLTDSRDRRFSSSSLKACRSSSSSSRGEAERTLGVQSGVACKDGSQMEVCYAKGRGRACAAHVPGSSPPPQTADGLTVTSFPATQRVLRSCGAVRRCAGSIVSRLVTTWGGGGAEVRGIHVDISSRGKRGGRHARRLALAHASLAAPLWHRQTLSTSTRRGTRRGRDGSARAGQSSSWCCPPAPRGEESTLDVALCVHREARHHAQRLTVSERNGG